MSAVQVVISTRAYRSSHGAEPKGCGGWMFVFGKEDYDDVSEAVFCPAKSANGGPPTYAEAAKWAKQEAVRRGVRLVGVCP